MNPSFAIDSISLDKAAWQSVGKGHVTIEGRIYTIDRVEDVLDLAELFEILVARHWKKLLKKKPHVIARTGLSLRTLHAMPAEDSPIEGAPQGARWYLEIGVGAFLYHVWFATVPELVQQLYETIRDVQAPLIHATPETVQ